MAHFVFDTTRDPILVLRFPDTYSDVELDEILNKLRTFTRYHGDNPFVLVIDMAPLRRSEPKKRQRWLHYLDEEDAYYVRNCRGAAFIVPSALQRGAITALLWMKRPSYPVSAFATQAEAEAWLRKQALSLTLG